MKIAIINDTHWGARNDSQQFLDYFKKFVDNIFLPYIDENKIDTVIHLGDIVDRRKYINYVTLRHLKDNLIQPLLKRQIDLHVIIGNHDVPYKNTNDINSMAELFDKHSVRYYSEPEMVTFDYTDILFVPWINTSNYAKSLDMIKNTKAQICMGHLEIAGCTLMRGITSDHGISIDTFKHFDTVLSGHFHTKSTSSNVHYLGTQYELTWSDYQDPKGFHVFDTKTREIEMIRNPYRMFHKVFYDDVKNTSDEILHKDYSMYGNTYVKVITQEKENPYTFDLFMDKLYQENPIAVQIVDDHLNLHLEGDDDLINQTQDTVTILSNYIENMETSVPKKRLDNLMRTLYNEALYMEV